MRVARCPRVIQAPPCRPLRIRPQLMRRARAYSSKSLPNLKSKFGQLETLPDRLKENGFTMWKGFLTQQEQEKVVNGLLTANLRGEKVDESIGTFTRYREPFDELLELMEKINDSGLLRGVHRDEENVGVFWVDDIEPTQQVEPTFELPGTGDRTFLVNLFSSVVLQLHQEAENREVTRILFEPGSLLALTGAAKEDWVRSIDTTHMWNGRKLPVRRRIEFKLIPALDREYMQRLADASDKWLDGKPPAEPSS